MTLTTQTGLWHDYSYGYVRGATLTIPIREGNYLISSLALLVSWAGISAWKVCSYMIHQSRANRSIDNVLSIQLQVLLREQAAAPGTVLDTLKLHRAWKSQGKQVGCRTWAVTLIALSVWLSFAVAGVFVAEVGTRSDQDVVGLAQPSNCGFINWFDNSSQGLAVFESKVLNDTLAAKTYVSSFYGGDASSVSIQSLFQSITLPFTINTNVDCPWNRTGLTYCLGVNRTRSTAMSLDTGLLDSHIHFDVNAPESDRVAYRRVVTCAPVKTYNFTVGPITLQNNETILELHIGGPKGDTLGTSPNPTFDWNIHTFYDNIGYTLRLSYSLAHSPRGTFEPIPTFNRTDADVTAFFLAQNSVHYYDRVFDPWFSANGTYNETTDNTTYFIADYDFNLMVCMDQFQFCNNNSDAQVCTNLTNAEDVALESTRLGYNQAQNYTASRLLYASGSTQTYTGFIDLGAAGLLAQQSLFANTFSAKLPDNQWQAEVQRWFEVSLVKMQATMIDFISNTWVSNFTTVAVGSIADMPESPQKDIATFQCHNQRIRSSSTVQNFSLLGVVIVIVISCVLIVVGFFVESCVTLFRRKHPTGVGTARQLARDADSKQALLQMALEGAGVKDWVSSSFGIPVNNGDHVVIPKLLRDNGLAKYKVPQVDVSAEDKAMDGPDIQ